MMDTDTLFAHYLSPKSKTSRQVGNSNEHFTLTSSQIRLSPPRNANAEPKSFIKDKHQNLPYVQAQVKAVMKSASDIADLLEECGNDCTAQFALRRFRIDFDSLQRALS